MFRQALPYAAGRERRQATIALLISVLGHALVFGLFVYTPRPDSSRFDMSSVMQVQMVDLGGGGASTEVTSVASSDQGPEAAPAPAQEAPSAEETAPPADVAAATSSEEVTPEVSLAPRTPQAKTALKYQTMRPRETPRETPPPQPRQTTARATQPQPQPQPQVNPLEETIRRLREQVEKEGRSSSGGGAGGGEGTAADGRGGFGIGSRQEIEAIDLYRLEVAFAIQKNWAFADQMGGGRGDRVASIVFKVMPDGRIEDVFFTDRSGNPYLDDSAYRAIVKSSPVRPHPDELRRPYIEMGLRFTPKGIQ